MSIQIVIQTGAPKVWERFAEATVPTSNRMLDWSRGRDFDSLHIDAAALEFTANIRPLQDLPGFPGVYAAAYRLAMEAVGRATNSDKALRARAQKLCDALTLVETYRFAFVVGQDNPDA